MNHTVDTISNNALLLKTIQMDPNSQSVDGVVETDVKYQDIVYYKDDGTESFRDKTIDFIKAVNEMNLLPWTYTDNFIGFVNRKNNDNLQFLRFDENDWYADVPINGGCNWDGYSWGCRVDTKTAASTLRLFFEEVPWFGMINGWTMRRYNKRIDHCRYPGVT